MRQAVLLWAPAEADPRSGFEHRNTTWKMQDAALGSRSEAGKGRKPSKDLSLPPVTVGSAAHPLSKLLGNGAKHIHQNDPTQKGWLFLQVAF